MDVVAVPTSLLAAHPAQRVVTEDTPTVDILLPNVSALRRDPPGVERYVALMERFRSVPAAQHAVWNPRVVLAIQGLLARRGLVGTGVEILHYAIAQLAARHGRIVEPIARLPLQAMPLDALDTWEPALSPSVGSIPPGAFIPPVVLTRDRLVFDPRLVPLIPMPVLVAAIFQRALDLFFRATERVEAVRRGNLSIGGKPVRADVVLATVAAQSQDMMAKLGVPQTFGGVYGFTDVDGDTTLLSFALDPELAGDVTWKESFAGAYARLYDRLRGSEHSPSPSTSPSTSPANEDRDPEAGHGAGANPDAPSPHVMDRETADALFGRGPSPGSDMTPSDVEREKIASDLADRFPGTEPAWELRKLVERVPPSPPTLGAVLRRWAEDRVASSMTDDRSPFRWSQPIWRRYGFWEPARALPSLGDVAVVIDTSGSMGPAEFEKLARAVQEMCTVGLPDTMRVIACDTQVHEVATLPRYRLADLAYTGESWVELLGPYRARVRGGGGTDMGVGIAAALRPPVETDEEPGGDVELRTDPRMWAPPSLVIVLTDGWTPWPDAPPVPVVVGTTDKPGPDWAETVKL